MNAFFLMHAVPFYYQHFLFTHSYTRHCSPRKQKTISQLCSSNTPKKLPELSGDLAVNPAVNRSSSRGISSSGSVSHQGPDKSLCSNRYLSRSAQKLRNAFIVRGCRATFTGLQVLADASSVNWVETIMNLQGSQGPRKMTWRATFGLWVLAPSAFILFTLQNLHPNPVNAPFSPLFLIG